MVGAAAYLATVRGDSPIVQLIPREQNDHD